MTPTQRERLQRQLDTWKSELVNLDRRNPLLYFKHNKSSTLEITAPELDEVWDAITSGKTFRFFHPPEPPTDEDIDDESIEDDVELLLEPPPDPEPDQLVTQKTTVADLDRTLRALGRRSRQAFIDTGFNIVYLGFGMLRWHDGERPAEAPLLLLPVELARASPRSEFTLTAGDGDVVVNPAILVKLERDLGIPIDDFDDQMRTPDDVLAVFAELADGYDGWSVERRVVIGPFTFMREAMYRDLVENEAVIADNALVQAMALGPTAGSARELVFNPLDAFHVDERAPAISSFAVADADSTQRICLHAASEGRSFVMDGPPGTGKSQTITNMIAEFMHAGKTVLFVSEKAAALDVVHNRLKAVQLDRFVLELHSHKATRKEVAQELGRALRERPTAPQTFSKISERRLADSIKQLSGYAHAVNEIRPGLERSLFDVLGRLTELADAPVVRPPALTRPQMTPDVEADLERIGGNLSRAWGPVEHGDQFLWRQVERDRLDALGPGELDMLLATATEAIQDLLEHTTAVDSMFDLAWATDGEGEMKRAAFLDLVESHSRRLDVPDNWLTDGIAIRLGEIDAARSSAERLARALNDATALGLADWTQLPPTGESQLTQARAAIDVLDPPIKLAESSTATQLNLLDGALDDALSSTAPILADAEFLIERFGLVDRAEAANVDRLREIAQLGQMAASADRPEGTWLNPLIQATLAEAVGALSALISDYRVRRETAVEVFAPTVIDLDIASIKSRVVNATGFAKLGGAYRSAKAELRPHVLSGKVKPDTIAALDHALAWKNVSDQLRVAEQQRAHLLGRFYEGPETTDLARLERALETSKRALDLSNGGSFDALAQQLGADAEPDAEAYQLAVGLERRLDQWAQHEWTAPLPRVEDVGAVARWTPRARDALGGLRVVLATIGALVGEEVSIDRCRELIQARDTVADASGVFETSAAPIGAVLTATTISTDFDFDALADDVRWVADVRSHLDDSIGTDTARQVKAVDGDASHYRRSVGALDEATRSIVQLFEPEQRAVVAGDLAVALTDAAVFVEELRASQEDLEEWVRFSDSYDELVTLGFADPVNDLVADAVDSDRVLPALQRSMLGTWAGRVTSSDERLKPMQSADRDALVADFQRLDAERVDAAAAMVINQCTSRRPEIAVGAAAIIKREAEKKTRHMPIRRLIEQTGEIALRLKPCFMMSPMSVSHFLPSDIRFDVVIFDEASQVKPSDAINCVYRGAQLIVAGDPKQLPPSSFFERGTATDDEYDEEEPDDFESVLDSMRSSGVPMLPLSWHYRSRHEDLITFSNRRFYDSRLLTFPGAIDVAPDYGVEFFHVADGVYDRGGARNNPIEARAVVDRVLHHRGLHPELSIGVVAFSEAQASRIEAELERAASTHSVLDDVLSTDRLDGLFVKNLENVQGDERDVIIFSVGYGRDEVGKFTENFGPLNRDGGERRLNVAITRARQRVEVVSSITSDDITGKSIKRGVVELKRYLAFAERGVETLAQEVSETGLDAESPFEEDVIRAITSLGFDAVPQVGVAGYRIDIGVRHPSRPGRFLLAVECDGAAYHSSQVARDRDRLRQEVLEGLGWTVLRIWGPSWYRTREREVERLSRALNAAVRGKRPAAVQSRSEVEVSIGEADFEAAPSFTVPYEVHSSSRYEFVDATDPHDRQRLAELIDEVVVAEGPVHSEVLRRRVTVALGVQRMGSKIRAGYESALKYAQNLGMVKHSPGDFWVSTKSPYDKSSSPIRRSTDNPESQRKVAHVPHAELDAAMLAVLEVSGGIDTHELIRVTRSVFGWGRSGADIQRALEDTTERLRKSGELEWS